MNKKERSSKQEIAAMLFIHSGYDGKEIAEHLGVTQKTVSEWKEKGEWTRLKAAQTVTKEKLVTNMYDSILDIQEKVREAGRLQTAAETDQILKLAKAAELMDKKVSIPLSISVFKAFNEFCVNSKLTNLKEYMDLQKRFVQTLITN